MTRVSILAEISLFIILVLDSKDKGVFMLYVIL